MLTIDHIVEVGTTEKVAGAVWSQQDDVSVLRTSLHVHVLVLLPVFQTGSTVRASSARTW